MSGWLIQVPVRRVGTEPIVHLYAVWVPDKTDALAAVEKQVDAPNDARAAGRIVGRDIEGAGTLARRRMSHPRQVVNGLNRRKPHHVRQTRSFSLAAFGMLILSHITGAQPLGINPSAAPSDLRNPSCARGTHGRLNNADSCTLGVGVLGLVAKDANAGTLFLAS